MFSVFLKLIAHKVIQKSCETTKPNCKRIHVLVFCVFSVEVQVDVWDSLGSKTSVCQLPVNVAAMTTSSHNETEEQYL